MLLTKVFKSFIATFALGCLPSSLGTSLPTATLDAGAIVGTTTSLPAASTIVNQFLGVPFAQSPPERFSPPQAPAQWSETLDTTDRKPACVQQFVCEPPLNSTKHSLLMRIDPEAARNFTQLVFNNPPPEESEDCLYLNVFAPASPAGGSGRAVLYWIYGGGLQFGYAGLPAYDGSAFAAYEDVIVVTVNYRTNGMFSSHVL